MSDIDVKNTEWIKVTETDVAGVRMVEYVDPTNTYCRQVWNDGYEEIFEIAT